MNRAEKEAYLRDYELLKKQGKPFFQYAVMKDSTMAYLTYAGANAGPPTAIDLKVSRQYEAGKEIVAQSGCLACHKIGDNGNGTLGPNLTQIGARIPRNAILRSLRAGPSIMPSFG